MLSNGFSGSSGSWRLVVAALLASASVGCSHPDAPTDHVGETSEALSPATARIFGFESLEDWSSLWPKPVLSLSPVHSEGQFSLALNGGGWMQIVNRPIAKEDPAPSVVGYDIRVPTNPVNQWWWGRTDLFIE